jgi:hypothetical protein
LPVPRRRTFAVPQDGELGLLQGFHLAELFVPEVLIELAYQTLGGLIAHFPEAGNDCLGAGDLERSLQSQETLAASLTAKPGLAGGKNDQLDGPQIQGGRF